MDDRKITYFLAVAEHGSLSAAAQALRVSQPTLTRQVQAIEDEYRTPLFARSGRRMVLTEAGVQLHEGLQSIERQLRLLKHDVAAVSVEPSGEVAFGIPPSPRNLIAIPVLKAFSAAHPKVMVRVVEQTSAVLRDQIASGILDVAIINTHEPQDGVLAKTIGKEQMLLVGPSDAKLSMRRETPIKDLAGLPLILTVRPNSLRLAVDSGLASVGVRAHVKFESSTLPMMTDLVLAGLGYTILPGCGARDLLKASKVTASPIAGLWITWMVARPKTRSLGAAAERFHRLLLEVAQKQVRDGAWQPARP